MPELDGQLAVRPGRVREYQIQQAPFLCDRTIFEAFAGLTRQLQQGNSFLHVRLIGEFVLIDRLLKATLLGPVLLGLLVEELDTDTSIEAVGVHDVDAALEQPVLVLEAVDGFFAEVLLISLAPHQDVSDTAQRLVVEGEATHVLGELLVEDFFPDVGFRAFSLVVRAVIVDVPLFLQLTHEQTTTVAAPDELRKGEFTFRLPAFRCAAISPDLLDLVPQFTGHEWLMTANVRLVFPDELAVVERILQHVLDDRPEAAVL